MVQRRELLKNVVSQALVWTQVDGLFRYLNRHQVLVIMYHGITTEHYDPPVWTQLSAEVFRRQIEFLRRHYKVVALSDFLAALRGETNLPEKAALITFDDGLRNNYTVAYPLLQEFGLPATIFLTSDFIGSERLLWPDELLLLLKRAAEKKKWQEVPEPARRELQKGRLSSAFNALVEILKRSGEERREDVLERLRQGEPPTAANFQDFGLLAWPEILEMSHSGLVEFGVHTARHSILTDLPREKWEAELLRPKVEIEKKLGCQVAAFCYPNGRPGLDFGREHQEFLAAAGYSCAFSTSDEYFVPRKSNQMAIGRVSVGSDGTALPNFFRLNTSGAISWLRQSCGLRPAVQFFPLASAKRSSFQESEDILSGSL